MMRKFESFRNCRELPVLSRERRGGKGQIVINRYELVIYGRGFNDELITIRELGRLVGLHPDKLRRYIVLGLIDPEIENPEPLFEDSIVARVHKIERLKKRPRAQP